MMKIFSLKGFFQRTRTTESSNNDDSNRTDNSSDQKPAGSHFKHGVVGEGAHEQPSNPSTTLQTALQSLTIQRTTGTLPTIVENATAILPVSIVRKRGRKIKSGFSVDGSIPWQAHASDIDIQNQIHLANTQSLGHAAVALSKPLIQVDNWKNHHGTIVNDPPAHRPRNFSIGASEYYDANKCMECSNGDDDDNFRSDNSRDQKPAVSHCNHGVVHQDWKHDRLSILMLRPSTTQQSAPSSARKSSQTKNPEFSIDHSTTLQGRTFVFDHPKQLHQAGISLGHPIKSLISNITYGSDPPGDIPWSIDYSMGAANDYHGNQCAENGLLVEGGQNITSPTNKPAKETEEEFDIAPCVYPLARSIDELFANDELAVVQMVAAETLDDVRFKHQSGSYIQTKPIPMAPPHPAEARDISNPKIECRAWKMIHPPNTIRWGCGIATWGRDKLLIVGGWEIDTNMPLNSIDVYDFQSKTWLADLHQPKLKSPRAECSIVVINDYLYIFGGVDTDEFVQTYEIIHLPGIYEHQELSMSDCCAGLTAVAANGFIFLVGPEDTSLIYDIVRQTFSPMTSMGSKWGSIDDPFLPIPAVLQGEQILVPDLNGVHVFNTRLRVWKNSGNNFCKRNVAAAVSFGKEILAVAEAGWMKYCSTEQGVEVRSLTTNAGQPLILKGDRFCVASVQEKLISVRRNGDVVSLSITPHVDFSDGAFASLDRQKIGLVDNKWYSQPAPSRFHSVLKVPTISDSPWVKEKLQKSHPSHNDEDGEHSINDLSKKFQDSIDTESTETGAKHQLAGPDVAVVNDALGQVGHLTEVAMKTIETGCKDPIHSEDSSNQVPTDDGKLNVANAVAFSLRTVSIGVCLFLILQPMTKVLCASMVCILVYSTLQKMSHDHVSENPRPTTRTDVHADVHGHSGNELERLPPIKANFTEYPTDQSDWPILQDDIKQYEIVTCENQEPGDLPSDCPVVESNGCHRTDPIEPGGTKFGPTFSIFVSHAKGDENAAFLAVNIMRELDRSFSDAVQGQISHIQESDIFICLVSKEWYSQHCCMQELMMAIEGKCRIIPLFTECGLVDYSEDFRREFHKCHLYHDETEVIGAVIDEFWCNLVKLQEIQRGPTYQSKHKDMPSYLNAVVKCVGIGVVKLQRERVGRFEWAKQSADFVNISNSCHSTGLEEPYGAGDQLGEPIGSDSGSSKGRVFVNYTGQNKNGAMLAQNISQELGRQCYCCFYDAWSLTGGDPWKLSIESHIESSDLFLCIVSKEWYFRYWCMRELKVAMESKCRIILLFTKCGKDVVYNRAFREEFYKRHLAYNKKTVTGAMIDTFWMNLRKLHHLNPGPALPSSQSCYSLEDYMVAVRCWIESEMDWQRTSIVG